MSDYLMESPDEAGRLEAKTKTKDSQEQLQLVGLSEGMRALDAGAGTGAVARVMANLVGASGSVVALDQSQNRLEAGRNLAAGVRNLEFQQGDLYDTKLPSESFDLVWSRFVFEYLAEPHRALAELIRVTKVGGKIVLADLDGNGVFHYPLSDYISSGLRKLLPALEGHFDPHAGRKLYSWLHEAGLRDLRVHALPYHLYASSISESDLENWNEKFRVIRPYAMKGFGSDGAYDDFVGAFIEMLQDPSVMSYSVLLIAEGVR
jgi:ubiquinone/menaquinone biosynthesis C-methylase UbiE